MHRYKPLQPVNLVRGRNGFEYWRDGQLFAPVPQSLGLRTTLSSTSSPSGLCHTHFVVLMIGLADGSDLADLLGWADHAASIGERFNLHVVVLDALPLGTECLSVLMAAHALSPAMQAHLRSQWPEVLPGTHRLWFLEDRLCVDLIYGQEDVSLDQWQGQFNLAVLNGVDPDRHPSAWRARSWYTLARKAAAGAGLNTRLADVQTLELARRAGWLPADAAGHVLTLDETAVRLRRPGSTATNLLTASPNASAYPLNRGSHAAVIGAGLAGVAMAAELAQAGYRITLIDSGSGLCGGASGNPVGAFHPHVSIDDATVSRLSRLGIGATVNSLRRLTEKGLLIEGLDWGLSGHVQLFDGALDEERFSKALDTLKWPANWVCKLTEQQIEARLGLKPSTAGLWLRQAGWCKPKRWCEALLAAVDMRHGEGMALIPGVERLFDAHVLAVLPQQQCVEIHIEQQMPTGAVQRQCVVDRVVIAAAQNSLPLFVQPLTEQKTVKGQVSILKADQRLQHVVSGASYAIALDDAHWLIGATFERPAQDCSVTQEAHQHNLAMFQNAFRASGLNEICGGRSAIRCAWPDRLPAIGPALDSQGRTQQGVWFASGFGSRGLTWAAMSAEYIRDVWTGQPSALSQDLVAAVLPGRFFSRASNSKPTLPSLPNTR